MRARPGLEFLGLRPYLLVARPEAVHGVPFALDEGVADEHLARLLGTHRAPQNGAVGHDGHAVEQHLLRGHGRAAALGPAWLGVGALGEVAREFLGPFGLDGGHVACPQPMRLDQFRGHDKAGRLAVQRRAGVDREAHAARAQVLVGRELAGAAHGERPRLSPQMGERRGLDVAGLLRADLRQQAREHAAVDGLLIPGVGQARGRGFGGLGGGRRPMPGHGDPERLGRVADLFDHILPLTNAQVVEVFCAHQAAERTAGQGLALCPQVLPEVEVAEQVRGGIGKALVEGLCGLALLGRALARVLNGQRGRDHGHLMGHAVTLRLDDHARLTGVHRQPREHPSHLGQPQRAASVRTSLGPHRAQFGEQSHAVADRARVGRLDKGEGGHVIGPGHHPHGDHLQQHGRERGAQYLRLGELGPAREVLLAVQADRDAVGQAPGASRALVGARLRDGLDGQALHLGGLGVARDAGSAGIDHVVDAGHGERGLGHIRGQHDAARGMRLEDPMLFGGAQARVQGQQFHGLRVARALVPRAMRARPQVPGQGIGGIPDLPLAGQEDEDVPGSLPHELVAGLD